MEIEKNVLRRKYTMYDRFLDFKEAANRWYVRQLTTFIVVGVDMTLPRLRWWPVIAIAVHDIVWLAAVALSDVAANSSSGTALWVMQIFNFFK